MPTKPFFVLLECADGCYGSLLAVLEPPHAARAGSLAVDVFLPEGRLATTAIQLGLAAGKRGL